MVVPSFLIPGKESASDLAYNIERKLIGWSCLDLIIAYMLLTSLPDICIDGHGFLPARENRLSWSSRCRLIQ